MLLNGFLSLLSFFCGGVEGDLGHGNAVEHYVFCRFDLAFYTPDTLSGTRNHTTEQYEKLHSAWEGSTFLAVDAFVCTRNHSRKSWNKLHSTWERSTFLNCRRLCVKQKPFTETYIKNCIPLRKSTPFSCSRHLVCHQKPHLKIT